MGVESKSSILKKEVRVSLSWPPSVNHYLGVHGKRRYIKKRGIDYRWEAIHTKPAGLSKITGPISIGIKAFPPDKRKRDLDNLLKCLLDALENAGFYEDDSQVQELIVQRARPVKGGLLDVTIRNYMLLE